MRLASFIRANYKPIAAEWEMFARSLTPASESMSPLALRDHIKEILAFVADDIESSQTDTEQVEKSRGEKAPLAKRSAAEIHASLRHAGGFNMDQMVSEYRALRASIVKLWDAQLTEGTKTDINDMTRFNEAIDQALTESISDYSKRIDHSRNLFLGILSHDLRSPLGAARMSAELTLRMGGENLDPRQRMLVTQVIECSDRATEIVDHLLDLTRARLGSGIPVIRTLTDMGYVGNKLVDEMRTRYPERTFTLTITGDMEGEWDQPRIGQIYSNLLGNAVQYGFKDTPIHVTLQGEGKDVVLSIQNQGVPIPPDAIGRIFESLIRGKDELDDEADNAPESINLGLGLYITKEIVAAHEGTIEVTSSEKEGTMFTVRLPRAPSEPTEANDN